MIFNVHAGHNAFTPGASKFLNEVTENRKVKNYLIGYLKEAGHTVYDCTDDAGKNANSNLENIVSKCNAHSVNLDVSIHLNAGGGTGVEVFNYDAQTKDASDRICSKVSTTLGLSNRGTKYSKNLYVLNNTNSRALLVECCFVDSTTDRDKWNAQKCAKAIAEGILNSAINKPTTPIKPVATNSNVEVTYMVKTAAGKWLSPIVDYNTINSNGFAGIEGYSITDVAIKVSKGAVKYRVHVKGGDWLPYVTGFNPNDFKNGYAGEGRIIDAIEVIYNGDKKAIYRTSPINSTAYFPWQIQNLKGPGLDGYAGEFGKAMDKLQIYIK